MRVVLIFFFFFFYYFQQRQNGFKRFIICNPIDGLQTLLSYRNYVGSQHGFGLSCRNLLVCAWNLMGSVHRSNWSFSLRKPI
jgi:hypothetical protein